MQDLPFTLLDVFANEPYAGNQLAVFKNAGDLPAEIMQKIACEINFSETTFICSGKQADESYSVRIFTPNEEIPFAGHPTLGTAYVIQDEIELEPQSTIKLNLKVGHIPVSFPDGKDNILWMRQREPEFGEVLSLDSILSLTNLSKNAFLPHYPMQIVSTGLPCVIVPMQSLSDIQSLQWNKPALDAFIQTCPAKAVLAFCAETVDPAADIHARFFAEYYGVPEDPATGSANGCLAAYLFHHNFYGGGPIVKTVEQGMEMGRPSRLSIQAEKMENGLAIQVGGRVRKVAIGTWY